MGCFPLLGALLLVFAGPGWAAEIKPINAPFNSKADETDPHVGSNGLVLYYASNPKGKFDIFVSKRASARNDWGAGQVLQDYVQTEVDDRGVSVTPEGAYPQFLFYATQKDKEQKNFDLYVAVKQGAGKAFSSPTPVQTVNTKDDEMHPWLSTDGKQLYFSRQVAGKWRVFVTSRQAATGGGGFETPTMVEDLPADFHHAALSPDGKTMYLQGPLEKGRWGLFTSAKTATGWGKPEAIEGLNNAEGPTGDQAPCVSRDGTLLYFASDRPGGKGGLDIWFVPTAQLKK